MRNGILLAASVVLGVVKSALMKGYSSKTGEDNSGIFRFNLIAYAAAAVIQWAVTGIPVMTLQTALPALGYAVSCCLMQLFLMKSMGCGTMGLSSLFCMYGMIIPTLAGPLFFSESFSPLKALGVVLMILAIFFSVDFRKGEGGGSKKWLCFALLTLFFSGMVGVFEKVHQTGTDRENIQAFLSCAFLLIALFNGAALTAAAKKEKTAGNFRKGLAIAAATGVVIAVYSRVNLTLAGALDTMIYYPISSGGSILLTLAVSVLIFREPLRRSHILCFAFGTAAILLLGIF